MSSLDLFETKSHSLIKDKLKLFLSIIRDFQNYLRFKNKRDEQLEIDKTQLNLIGEIITTKNLKKLIISVDSKFTKEKAQKSNNNLAENIPNNSDRLRQTNASNTGTRNNKSCFGQRLITSKNVFYVSENEKNLIKESTLKQIKAKIKNSTYSQLLSKDNHISKSSNFVLRNIINHNHLEPYSFSTNNLNLPDFNYILPTESFEKNDKIRNKLSPSGKQNQIQRNFIQVGNVIDSMKYNFNPQDHSYKHKRIKNKVEKLKELYSNILNNKIFTSKGNLRFDKVNGGSGMNDLKQKLFGESKGLVKIDDYKYLNKNEHDLKLNNFMVNRAEDKNFPIEKSNNELQSPNKVDLPLIGKEEIYKSNSPSKINHNSLYNYKWRNCFKKNNIESRKKIKIALNYEYR